MRVFESVGVQACKGWLIAPGQCCWSRHLSTVDDLEPQQLNWDDSITSRWSIPNNGVKFHWTKDVGLNPTFPQKVTPRAYSWGVTLRPRNFLFRPSLHPSQGWWLNHPAQVKLDHPPKVGVNKQKHLKPPPRSSNLEGFGNFSPNFAALKRVLTECSSADLPQLSTPYRILPRSPKWEAPRPSLQDGRDKEIYSSIYKKTQEKCWRWYCSMLEKQNYPCSRSWFAGGTWLACGPCIFPQSYTTHLQRYILLPYGQILFTLYSDVMDTSAQNLSTGVTSSIKKRKALKTKKHHMARF